jgi:hypothetical protein
VLAWWWTGQGQWDGGARTEEAGNDGYADFGGDCVGVHVRDCCGGFITRTACLRFFCSASSGIRRFNWDVIFGPCSWGSSLEALRPFPRARLGDSGRLWLRSFNDPLSVGACISSFPLPLRSKLPNLLSKPDIPDHSCKTADDDQHGEVPEGIIA